MTRDEAAKVVAMLKAAFPHQPFPTDSARVYIEFLLDLDVDAALRAVRRLIAEPGRRFMPTIGEIRGAALDVVAPVPLPEEAWGEVVQQIHAEGYYGRPRFSHPVIYQAVEAIGWREICLSEEPGVVRAHFMRAYETLRQRYVHDVSAEPLGAALPRPVARRSLAGGEE